MYLAVESRKTCATAWLEAVKKVSNAPGREAHNVVLDIEEPFACGEADARIEKLVDDFLRKHEAMPLQAVVNTIFPERLYRRYGVPAFYDIYLKEVYPRIKQKCDWGRYFERMINHRTSDDRIINPLADLVEKLRQHVHENDRTFRNVYELSVRDPRTEIQIYNPERDSGRVMNRQCLSYLSFKLDTQNRLMLTVLYRNLRGGREARSIFYFSSRRGRCDHCPSKNLFFIKACATEENTLAPDTAETAPGIGRAFPESGPPVPPPAGSARKKPVCPESD